MTTSLIRLAAGLLIVLVLAQCSPQRSLELPPAAMIRADAGVVTDASEIVVLAQTRAQMDELVAAAAGQGYALRRTRVLTSLGLVMSVMTIPAGQGGAAAIAELEALVPGVIAGVNHAYVTANTAAIAGRLYADALLGWPPGGCRARQPIGVIDAAAPGLVPAPRFRSFTPAPSTEPRHGAQVVALLTRQGRLEAPDLYVANVIGQSARGRSEASVDAMVAALSWLHAEGVRLVNVSLAGPYNKILDHASARASQRGMVIVAAAGNDGAASPPRYPAAFSRVIAVTAVDANKALYRRAVTGPHIDIAAPGVDLFVGGRYVTGSSFAAPFVTAYLAAAGPRGMTAEAARALLRSTAADLGAPGRDPAFGEGLLNLGQRCAPR